MLTTDLKPSKGTIYVTDERETKIINGIENKKSYWNSIGYCPQFDAL